MYAKMINGHPAYLTLPVTVNGERIYTNDEAILLRLGYKHYREEDRRSGTGATAVTAVKYEETEREIIRVIYSIGGDANV